MLEPPTTYITLYANETMEYTPTAFNVVALLSKMVVIMFVKENHSCLTLELASFPDPAQNWEKGLVTLAKILICAVSAVFVWGRGITFGPLPITTFLTHEGSRLVPKPFEMETRLFGNLECIYAC